MGPTLGNISINWGSYSACCCQVRTLLPAPHVFQSQIAQIWGRPLFWTTGLVWEDFLEEGSLRLGNENRDMNAEQGEKGSKVWGLVEGWMKAPRRLCACVTAFVRMLGPGQAPLLRAVCLVPRTVPGALPIACCSVAHSTALIARLCCTSGAASGTAPSWR